MEHGIKNFLGGRPADEMIDILYRLNVRAVNERYGDTTDETTTKAMIKESCVLKDVSVFQFLKSLECLHYQMSEGDVPKTKEYKLVEGLIESVKTAVINRIPEYNAANWG
jgi:hypothetical protein